MTDILKRQANRFRVLYTLYNTANGATNVWAELEGICAHLELPEDTLAAIYHYLIDEGFVNPYGAAYRVTLTHNGIKAVEQSCTNPNTATGLFPAFNAININAGKINKL